VVQELRQEASEKWAVVPQNVRTSPQDTPKRKPADVHLVHELGGFVTVNAVGVIAPGHNAEPE